MSASRSAAPIAPGATITPWALEVLAQIANVEVLTEEQAGVFLRPGRPISPTTLQTWRHRGLADGTQGPPFVKVGGLVSYLKSSLVEWMRSRERTSTTEEVRS